MSRRLSAVALFLSFSAVTAQAQAWSYPAFQPPVTETREFNFGVADAGRSGTTLLAQWREAAGALTQFTVEAGLISPEDGGGNLLLVGGQFAYQWNRSTSDVPLDLLFTAGAGVTIGDPIVLRIPAGLVAGHRFELEGNMALTPYVHPRLSLDLCGDCTIDQASLSIDFDVGANFEISSVIALRAAAFFGGGEIFKRNGVGISLAWKPPGLQRVVGGR
ncbi:MAG: hypothetical protein ACT4P7_00210 [Gemmatimonadaceae bacterium]